MKHCLTALMLSLTLGALPALGAELGRMEFNGKTVILHDDGTWTYAAAAAPVAGCAKGIEAKSKALPLSACFQSVNWKVTSSSNDDFELLYARRGGDMYGGFITERIPLDEETLRQAIIDNAAGDDGSDDVVITKEHDAMLGGAAWKYIEYQLVFGGTKFRFANYFKKLGEDGSAQVVFWTADKFFESERKTIEQVAETLAIAR